MPKRQRLTLLSCLLWLAASMGASSRALAADAEVRPPLAQEVVGLEAHVVSVAQGAGVSSRPGVGLGGMVRLGRHRWTHAYFTPLQLGLFVGGLDDASRVISARILTEGGFVLRGKSAVVELGLGAGAGFLAIGHGVNCDGTCVVGGEGVLLSPVVRWLFRETTPHPIGVVLRGEVPVVAPSGGGFGWFTGYGAQVLLGLDVALGCGAAGCLGR